ncbi:universal stress protein [Reyranella sp.]|uniref:universal stress protein n=1 Tax=Reyranella sp. TaxID=1929291 RepID=UPI003BA8CB8F
MPYKTILVHCDDHRAMATRMEIATGLAERFQAHLVGLNARPPFQPPAFSEGAYSMDLFFRDYETALNTGSAKAKEAFDAAVKGKEIATEWHSVDGRAEDLLTVHGRYADLTVVGQTDPDATGLPLVSDLPESVAVGTGRGTLVVPYVGTRAPLGRNILLCWNASRESSRAATEALPLLQGAASVTVLIVEPKSSPGGHGPQPGADVATWLSRHGVKVTVQCDVAPDTDVGGVILSRAMDLGSDLIVMGIYGHSRMREMVLGGASRTLLSGMTVPVLMAH